MAGIMRKSDITHYDFPQRDPRDFNVVWRNTEPLHWRLTGSKDPMTAPEVLDDYARDPYLIIRRNVAKNPNASKETLARLANDSDARTRIFVAQNPKTSARTLERLLSGDCDVYMYRNVAVHPNATGGILAQLAKHEDGVVRYNVARHPNAMKVTLSELLEDSYESIREMARKKLKAMEKEILKPAVQPTMKPTEHYYGKGVFM